MIPSELKLLETEEVHFMSKVWFITGSSSGFGRHFVEELISKGERVVATARSLGTITDLKESAPDQVHIVTLDVNNKDQIEQAVKEAVEVFGRIDIVVNNAGYGLRGMLEEYTDEQMKRQFDVNVFGVLNVVRATLPVFKKQQSGHYINFSSILGVMGIPTLSLYAASKFAVEGFSEAMALELQPFGIKTTIVEPSQFATDWSGRSMEHAERLPEYAPVYESTGKMLSTMQIGDPLKAIKAVITMVESENPPVHFPVGVDATYGIRQAYSKKIEEVIAWESLALDTVIDVVDK
jgi:NAD(P)-dependent dehydrogenase (short-subunit alcohol dehydrogenase family)